MTSRLSVRAAAAEAPDRDALVAPGLRLDYRALAARVDATAAALVAAGATPERPVAVIAEPSVETAVTVGALLELAIPALLVHPRLTPAERAALLAPVAPSIVVTPALFLGAASAGRRALPAAPPDDDRCALLIATAGSTGLPRLVRLSRRNLVAAADASAANLGWRDDDRWLLALPPAHVGGASVLVRCLVARRCAAIAAAPAAGFSPAALAAALAELRVTLLSLVPAQLARLLEELPDWRPPRHLRAVLVGGAAAPATLLARAAARGLPVLATYGASEACGQIATWRPGTPPSPAEGVGPALPGVAVRVVADRIWVRGPSVMLGYHPDDGGRTGDRGHGRVDADGWLDTGDLGRLDERGRLHVAGRADEVIVTGGENVHPAEVEAALLAHDSIAAACVFAVPDPVYGQRVAAAVVLRDAARAPAPAALRDHLAARLAAYKRPRRLAVLPALLLGAAGKIDRAATAAAATAHLQDL